MTVGKIARVKRNGIFLDEMSVSIASTFWERAVGLLGASQLERNASLLIQPCSDIHTYFMRFNIDVVFLARDYRVLSVKESVPSFRFVFGPKGAVAVLELGAGVAAVCGISVGDQLEFCVV